MPPAKSIENYRGEIVAIACVLRDRYPQLDIEDLVQAGLTQMVQEMGHVHLRRWPGVKQAMAEEMAFQLMPLPEIEMEQYWWADDPAVLLERCDTARELRKTMAGLYPAQETVLYLHYMEDWTYERIEREYKRNRGWAQGHASRGLVRLREWFANPQKLWFWKLTDWIDGKGRYDIPMFD